VVVAAGSRAVVPAVPGLADVFAKLVADPDTGRVLGAHVMGPEASNLIQPLVAAMAFGESAAEAVRGQYWIHPALIEVVENLLLGVAVDVPRTATPG
jgi:mycothione reductase